MFAEVFWSTCLKWLRAVTGVFFSPPRQPAVTIVYRPATADVYIYPLLEVQAQVRHPVEWSRGREASLVEVVGAVSLHAIGCLAEAWRRPAVVVKLAVEDVVERHADGDVF